MMQASRELNRITLHLNAPIAQLTLANPPLNVIDIPMMNELATTIAGIESQPAISTVMLSGAGKSFSAGVDVAAHTPDKIQGMLQSFHRVIRAVLNIKKITVAAVHGSCLGGAAELAMMCDIVMTSDSATWGFPEIKLGCFPPVAAAALSALIGQKRAADLILTGRSFSGTEAAEIGLATIAAPDEQFDSAVKEKLALLSRLSPSALAVTKKAIYAWDAAHFDKGLTRAESIYLAELMQSEDAQEGIRAFLEKRPPKWSGR
jgi:cyclohexa-1,5-dienecarbonyl-CoA hydratase